MTDRLITPSQLSLFSRSPVIGAWWEEVNATDPKRAPQPVVKALDDLLMEAGHEHEQVLIKRLEAEKKQVVRLDGEYREADYKATIAAMRSGADYIWQASMHNDEMRGSADMLERIEEPSAWRLELHPDRMQALSHPKPSTWCRPAPVRTTNANPWAAAGPVQALPRWCSVRALSQLRVLELVNNCVSDIATSEQGLTPTKNLKMLAITVGGSHTFKNGWRTRGFDTGRRYASEPEKQIARRWRHVDRQSGFIPRRSAVAGWIRRCSPDYVIRPRFKLLLSHAATTGLPIGYARLHNKEGTGDAPGSEYW